MHRTTLPRLRPVPGTVLGHRRDGRPILVMAGGAPEPGEGGTGTPPVPPVPPVPVPTPPAPVVVPPAAKIFTQDEVTALAAREKAQGQRAGERSALDALAKDAGLTDGDALKKYLLDVKAAEDAKLTDLERREKALVDDRAALLTQQQATAVAQREARHTRVLASLGASGDDLDDALLLLQRSVADDADDAALLAAAEALKTRRPIYFGGTAAVPAVPPAPGGAPAPGMPRPGATTPDAARERAHKRLVARGHIQQPAAK
jgi:hypothetical protein